MTKTEKIIDLAKADPHLTNTELAKMTGASVAFISKTRNRHGLPYQGPQRKSEVGRMCCEECGSTDILCRDSRPSVFRGRASIRRRRKCASCSYSWTTYEICEEWANPTAARDEVIKELEMLIMGLRNKA
jgi:hypothetical protein